MSKKEDNGKVVLDDDTHLTRFEKLEKEHYRKLKEEFNNN